MDDASENKVGSGDGSVKWAYDIADKLTGDMGMKLFAGVFKSASMEEREVMAAIIKGEENYKRLRNMMAGWVDGRDMVFPDAAIEWVRDFSARNSKREGEEGQSMGLSTVFYGVEEPAVLRASDWVAVEKDTLSKNSDRAGMIHSHGMGYDYIFSASDIKRLLFDPQINFSFLALSNGDIWMLARTVRPWEFAKFYINDKSEIDEQLDGMYKRIMAAEKSGMTTENKNNERLKDLGGICADTGLSLYKISAGENRAIRMDRRYNATNG